MLFQAGSESRFWKSEDHFGFRSNYADDEFALTRYAAGCD